MSVNTKMTAIADKIRTLLGVSGKMGLDAMDANLDTACTEVSNAYAAITEKGGTVPEALNIVNLSAAINSLSGLNFEVVGGTSAPANPAENTIWVNTSVPISDYIFSAIPPESGAEGSVWFSTGTTSPAAFNALKKNVVQVYPLSAMQIVNGQIVDVEAKIYQDGEWVDWGTVLYDAGNHFTEITGGWTNEGYRTKSWNCQAEINADNIHITFVPNAGVGGAGTRNVINFGSYSTLKANVLATKTCEMKVFAKTDRVDTDYLAVTNVAASSTIQTVSLSLEGVPNGYVGFTGDDAMIYKVWLE